MFQQNAEDVEWLGVCRNGIPEGTEIGLEKMEIGSL